jgi:hypothetical protein
MASEKANPNEVLDYVTETLRAAHGLLEGVDSETASLMKRHVERALLHAPTPQAKKRESDQGDFEPGTTIGDDGNARRVRELDGKPADAAPSPEEILAENARLQERVAELEASRNGGG